MPLSSKHLTLILGLATAGCVNNPSRGERESVPLGACTSWRTVARLSEPRANPGAVTLEDGRILVFGGRVFDERTGRIDAQVSSAEIVDPRTGAVTPVEPMPAVGHGQRGAAGAGVVYIFGGHVAGGQLILRYDADSDAWERGPIEYWNSDPRNEGVVLSSGELGRVPSSYDLQLVSPTAGPEDGVSSVSLAQNINQADIAAVGDHVWVAGIDFNNQIVLQDWQLGDAEFVVGPTMMPGETTEGEEGTLRLVAAADGDALVLAEPGGQLRKIDVSTGDDEILSGAAPPLLELAVASEDGARVWLDGSEARVLDVDSGETQVPPASTAQRAYATVVADRTIIHIGGIDALDWSQANALDIIEACP